MHISLSLSLSLFLFISPSLYTGCLWENIYFDTDIKKKKSVDKKKLLKNSGLSHFIRLNIPNYISASK